ncbi:MAG: class I SAM-dependent methyltransferase [Bradymonadales bacterium]|nr:class I SAM-dependent methyltransferase [Bradymonadales bacterium]
MADRIKDTEQYYDEFAEWYERERHEGYHALLDALEVDLVRPRAAGQDVLDVGCGTGLTLRHIAPIARRAVGVDISDGMLERARARGLDVFQASATELPFEDESFDLVYSFKVLPHVRELERALDELARVTRPGGALLLEFYNPLSLRYLVKRLKRGKISDTTTEAEVYTRFDSLRSLKRRLPPQLRLTGIRGIRVFTPVAAVYQIPLVKNLVERLEWWGRDSMFRHFGGFLVLELRKDGR